MTDPLRSPIAPPAAPLRLLVLDPLQWWAGHEYTLVALARARLAGARLLCSIVADGPEDLRVRYTIFDLDLDDAVELVRPDDPRAAGAVQAAELLVSSALAAAPPAGGVAARAEALPRLATRLAGDGGEARGTVLVARRDPDALSAALVRLDADRTVLAELRAAASSRAPGAASSAASLSEPT